MSNMVRKKSQLHLITTEVVASVYLELFSGTEANWCGAAAYVVLNSIILIPPTCPLKRVPGSC